MPAKAYPELYPYAREARTRGHPDGLLQLHARLRLDAFRAGQTAPRRVDGVGLRPERHRQARPAGDVPIDGQGLAGLYPSRLGAGADGASEGTLRPLQERDPGGVVRQPGLLFEGDHADLRETLMCADKPLMIVWSGL